MGPWLIKALNVGLMLASCYLVADVVTEIGAEALEPSAVQPGVTRPIEAGSVASVGPAVILERNFFGAQLAGDSQVEVFDDDVPLAATKLPLRLLGTAAASTEERSRAAIEDEKSRKHLVVAVGDRLSDAGLDRVKVKAIERTRVILDNAGRAEELVLHEDQPPARRAKPRPNARQARRRPAAAKESLNDRLKAMNGDDGQGLSRILSSARIVPDYNAAGEMQGMKVDAIKPDSIFERVGLVNGDVITEVNGIVIDRLEATSAIFDEFATADAINLAAKRGNSPILIEASADQIMEQP